MFSHLSQEQLEEYYLPKVLGDQFKSDYDYVPDLPVLIPGDKTKYRSLVEASLQDCKRIQKIVDAEYPHEHMIEKCTNEGQIFRQYKDDNHQVWAFNLMNDKYFTYINVHWIRDTDDLISDEFCNITGLTKDQIAYVHQDDKSKYLSILHVRTDVNFLFHIHKKDGLAADFLTHLEGDIDLLVASHPLNANYLRHSEKMTDMHLINPKQYHTGLAHSSDVFFISVQPLLSYQETLDIVHQHQNKA